VTEPPNTETALVTVREALMNGHRDVRLIPDALAALDAITYELAEVNRIAEYRDMTRQEWRDRAEAAEAEIRRLQEALDIAVELDHGLADHWEKSLHQMQARLDRAVSAVREIVKQNPNGFYGEEDTRAYLAEIEKSA
jgi:hypothetical protein